MSESQELTVSELVNEAQLGLTVLTGDLGLSRVIKNVHHSDFADPTPWMVDGTILITHGAALAKSPGDGPRYLDTIAGKTAALVVAVGEYLDHVPPELVEHASALGIPVLEAPRTLSLRDIFSYVYHSLSSADMHGLRRALAVQSQLLDLLVEDRGVENVVSRLSSILDLEIVLFDSEGEVIASAGRAGSLDTPAIWNVVADANFAGGPTGVIEAGRERVYVRRVVVHGELAGVLVAIPRAFVTSILVDMTLSYAQRLIGLSMLAERESIRFRRTMVSTLLREFLLHEDDAHDYADRLAAVGIDIGKPWRVVVMGARLGEQTGRIRSHARAQEWESLLERIADTAEESFRLLHVPVITTVMGDVVVALAMFGGLEGDDAVRSTLAEVLASIAEHIPGVRVYAGGSGRWIGASRPAALLRQGEEAGRLASQGAGVLEDLVLFDEATAGFRLLEGQSPEALTAMSKRVLEPLAEHDRTQHTALVKTIQAYFRNRMSAHDTTVELVIHRNTLYKRLGRIEELLGMDLDRMDDVVELYIALRATDLLEAPVQIGGGR
jgi:PucR family transcriptional regulator, purine catabolism regulatory protein